METIESQTNEEDYGYHRPVLPAESIEALNIIPEGIYVDCTYGGGGHSAKILQQLNSSGKLIAFDQDDDARRNLPDDNRILFLPHNFRHLQRFLKLHRIPPVNGVLADLGVSSFQFDQADRGFSTRFDGALDMRMDQRQKTRASDLLNTYPEEKLHRIFEQYGEVTNSKTLAKAIVDARRMGSFTNINQFKTAIHNLVKGNPNKYFAKVFQALRIEVNDELGALQELLGQLAGVMTSGGRAAIITFHSLEDRIVKNYFKKGEEDENDQNPFLNTKTELPFRIITKKPIVAGQKELSENPRSRSAKLRVAEKI